MKSKNLRIAGLIRFATAITILNLAGHFFLGFEQSVAHMVVALLTAYSLELAVEKLNAHICQREAFFSGGIKNLIYFLLPAHITAMAVSMLLFTNEGLMPVIFATSIAILSKTTFKAKINNRVRHFLNPSNAGIGVILILFPWVGIAPPYQFTENVFGIVDWILPLVFITAGSLLNTFYTKKMPLILSWLGGFILQASIRSLLFDTPLLAGLVPMTGVAFLLFTFYMISDPSTTPIKKENQVFFGLSVAAVYGLLMVLHIVFGLFFSLLIVCAIRGGYFWFQDFHYKPQTKAVKDATEISAKVGEPVSV